MQVVLSLRVGGLERVVVDLVNHSSDEFRFIVCCLEDTGALAGEIQPKRGKVVSLGKRPGVDWHMFWKVASLTHKEKIDVIHTHNSTAHIYGAVAARFTKARVLHTEHGKNIGQEARSLRLNRWADHFTDLTVTVSEAIAQQARDSKELKRSRLQVIPNGIRVRPLRCDAAQPGPSHRHRRKTCYGKELLALTTCYDCDS